MTTDERLQAVHDHAQAVAKALGWTYITPGPDPRRPYWAAITGPNGESLHVSLDKDRFHWGVQYPKGPDGRPMALEYRQVRPSITVAMTKTAPTVAAEITRRLLPLYLPQLESAKRRAAEATDYEALTRQNVTYLAAVLEAPDPGKTTERYGLERATIIRIPSREDSLYGDIRVHGTTANMELRNLSMALAAQILAVIRDAKSTPV